MLLVQEGGCEFVQPRALRAKRRNIKWVLPVQAAEQPVNHVTRHFGSATLLPPYSGDARFVDNRAGGRACLILPVLRHFVLSVQGLRWIEALIDPFHGGPPRIAFWNLLGD